MIKHVVMWKLRETAEQNDKEGNKKIIKEKLLELKQIIPEIDSMEIGENFNSSDTACDLVLITTHINGAALEAYLLHPAHKEAATFISRVVAERRVVDFEY